MAAKHIRHKPPTELERCRELILVCPEFKSRVNLSRIVRLAGCAGVKKIISAGQARLDPKIARDGAGEVVIERRRSLAPVIKRLRDDGFRIVGLEQADKSVSLFDYRFLRPTALVIGHERHGIHDDLMPLLEDVLEIPVYGLPYSYNVVTATTMAVYEYCRQFPAG